MHFHSRILLNQSAPWNNRRGGRAPDLFAPPPLHFFATFWRWFVLLSNYAKKRHQVVFLTPRLGPKKMHKIYMKKFGTSTRKKLRRFQSTTLQLKEAAFQWQKSQIPSGAGMWKLGMACFANQSHFGCNTAKRMAYFQRRTVSFRQGKHLNFSKGL